MPVALVGIFLVVFGLALFVIELVHPGAFLLIPGSIVLSAGFLYLFLPDILLDSPWGPGIVLMAAFLATLATVPYYKRIAPIHRPMSTTPSSLEGEVGVVVATVVPDTLRGKVRVRSEVWSARSDITIPEGARVRVLGGEGVSILVRPIEAPSAAAAEAH